MGAQGRSPWPGKMEFLAELIRTQLKLVKLWSKMLVAAAGKEVGGVGIQGRCRQGGGCGDRIPSCKNKTKIK
jgi:hypothetical protein